MEAGSGPSTILLRAILSPAFESQIPITRSWLISTSRPVSIYVNVGEGETRNWDDCRGLGFLAAGGSKPAWRAQISLLVEGDIVAAYLTGHGYVGVGRVQHRAVPYSQYLHEGLPLGAQNLAQPGLAHDAGDLEICEYIVAVDWLETVPREGAKRISKKKEGHYAPQRIRASLDDQPATITFIDESFGVSLREFADDGPMRASIACLASAGAMASFRRSRRILMSMCGYGIATLRDSSA